MANKKALLMSGGMGQVPQNVEQTLVEQPDGTYAPQVHIANQNLSISNTSAPYIWQQIVAGNGFVWSSGLIAGIAAATNIRAYINNPANSGRTLYIYSLVLDNGASSSIFCTLLANPTTNLPTTSRGNGSNLNMASQNTSPATLYADTGAAMSGGASLPNPLAVGNSRTEFLEDEQMFVVPPGYKAGINIPIAVGLSNNYQVVVYGIVM